MLNKKYQVYAVSLAILSFSQITADTAVHHAQNVVAKKLQHQNMKLIDHLLSNTPAYGLRMNLTSQRAGNVLDAIHQRKELVRQGSVVTQPLDELLGAIDASDELFIAKSIDQLFELIGSFLDTLRSQRSVLEPILCESLSRERAIELVTYFNAKGDIQEAIRKDIKTIDKLESVASSIKQLFEDIAASLQPSTEQKIKVLKDKMTAQQQASKK